MSESIKPENPWITHCRAYAKENNCSYKHAIKNAKATYVKKTVAPVKQPEPVKPVVSAPVVPVEEPVETIEQFKLLEIKVPKKKKNKKE